MGANLQRGFSNNYQDKKEKKRLISDVPSAQKKTVESKSIDKTGPSSPPNYYNRPDSPGNSPLSSKNSINGSTSTSLQSSAAENLGEARSAENTPSSSSTSPFYIDRATSPGLSSSNSKDGLPEAISVENTPASSSSSPFYNDRGTSPGISPSNSKNGLPKALSAENTPSSSSSSPFYNDQATSPGISPSNSKDGLPKALSAENTPSSSSSSPFYNDQATSPGISPSNSKDGLPETISVENTPSSPLSSPFYIDRATSPGISPSNSKDGLPETISVENAPFSSNDGLDRTALTEKTSLPSSPDGLPGSTSSTHTESLSDHDNGSTSIGSYKLRRSIGSDSLGRPRSRANYQALKTALGNSGYTESPSPLRTKLQDIGCQTDSSDYFNVCVGPSFISLPRENREEKQCQTEALGGAFSFPKEVKEKECQIDSTELQNASMVDSSKVSIIHVFPKVVVQDVVLTSQSAPPSPMVDNTTQTANVQDTPTSPVTQIIYCHCTRSISGQIQDSCRSKLPKTTYQRCEDGIYNLPCVVKFPKLDSSESLDEEEIGWRGPSSKMKPNGHVSSLSPKENRLPDVHVNCISEMKSFHSKHERLSREISRLDRYNSHIEALQRLQENRRRVDPGWFEKGAERKKRLAIQAHRPRKQKLLSRPLRLPLIHTGSMKQTSNGYETEIGAHCYDSTSVSESEQDCEPNCDFCSRSYFTKDSYNA